MQHMRGVLHLCAVPVRIQQPVALPFGVRITEQRDVIARHGGAFARLREYLGDVGKMRAQIDRQVGKRHANKKKLAARYVTASEITTSAVLASLDLAAGDIQPVSPNAS